MKRLCDETLASVPEGVHAPAYDRRAIRPGILHLGLGAFHRAHQAVYTDTAIARGGGDWGIVGVSLRSDRVARQLNPQDGLYSVLSEDQHGSRLQVVGAVQRVLVAPREPQAVELLLADPGIRVVTLTVTEKAYCLGKDGWSLDTNLGDIRADMAQPAAASSLVGTLARGLARRQRESGAPLSIISCDNLGENSARLQAVLLQYLEKTFPGAGAWLERDVAFPCSMADRIVPAPTGAVLERQSALLGLRDEGAIATEPYCQWIIEDSFAAEIPDWRAAGVQLVADIRPFEEIKLRLLNATHSAIAMSGLLAGHETVADVMADRALAPAVRHLMSAELVPPLTAPAGFDLSAYGEQLLQRFANPCLQHRCAQIATDSSEKIRQRWRATLRDQRGETELLRALARWCCLVMGTDHPLDDPRAELLLAIRASQDSTYSRLRAALECVGIGPEPDILQGDRIALLTRLVENFEQ